MSATGHSRRGPSRRATHGRICLVISSTSGQATWRRGRLWLSPRMTRRVVTELSCPGATMRSGMRFGLVVAMVLAVLPVSSATAAHRASSHRVKPIALHLHWRRFSGTGSSFGYDSDSGFVWLTRVTRTNPSPEPVLYDDRPGQALKAVAFDPGAGCEIGSVAGSWVTTSAPTERPGSRSFTR